MKYKISCLYDRNVSCASWGGSRDTAITYSSERIENLVPRIIGHKYNLERYIEKSDVKKRMYYEVLSNFSESEKEQIDNYLLSKCDLNSIIKERLLVDVYELYKNYMNQEAKRQKLKRQKYLKERNARIKAQNQSNNK